MPNVHEESSINKPSQLQWNGIWCAWICLRITNISFFHFVIQWVFVSLQCRGGPKKWPIEIADLVLLQNLNKAAEGLANNDRIDFDIYLGIADRKVLFLECCNSLKSAFAQCYIVTDASRWSSWRWIRSDKCLYHDSGIPMWCKSKKLNGLRHGFGTANSDSAANAGATVLPPAAGNDGDNSEDSGRTCVRTCEHASVRACVRASERASDRACVRARMLACVRASLRVCVRASEQASERACERACERASVRASGRASQWRTRWSSRSRRCRWWAARGTAAGCASPPPPATMTSATRRGPKRRRTRRPAPQSGTYEKRGGPTFPRFSSPRRRS